MGVLDKLLNAVKLNDDDFLEDDYMDEDDDDFLDFEDEEADLKPRTSFFKKFGKKSSAVDDLDDFDDLDEEPVSKKKEKKSKVKEKEKKAAAPKDDFDDEPKITFRTTPPKSPAPRAEKPAKSSKITPMRSSRRNSESISMEVCVVQPRSMEDTHTIADYLLENSTVILNLEGIDVELAQRISDFSFGACYSLGGRLQKISSYIFVLVPYNVDITGDLQNVLTASAPSIRAGY